MRLLDYWHGPRPGRRLTGKTVPILSLSVQLASVDVSRGTDRDRYSTFAEVSDGKA